MTRSGHVRPGCTCIRQIREVSRFLSQLIPDAKQLLSRTKPDEVYAALAEKIIASCEKQNWHDQEIELAFYLLNENRIKQPAGKIESLYTLLKIRKGEKAPGLAQGILPRKKASLLFTIRVAATAPYQ